MTNDRLPIIRVIARALCHSMRGTKRDCFCDGDTRRCHAAMLYDDFATAALFGLERAGYMILPPQITETSFTEHCDTVDRLAAEMAETLGKALDDMTAAWPEASP